MSLRLSFPALSLPALLGGCLAALLLGQPLSAWSQASPPAGAASAPISSAWSPPASAMTSKSSQ